MVRKRVLTKFFELEAAGGIMLMLAAVLALIVANIPATAGLYAELLHAPFEVRLGDWMLRKTVLLIINDGLMAVFFLLVALEIKREIMAGELSTVRQALLPCIAALGGMLIPAFIYVFFTAGDSTALHGWAIPTATDIAFSLGVLSLLGRGVPFSLKLLLTAVAVADDLGAILVIAIFYSGHLSYLALGLGGFGLAVLYVLNRMGVRTLGSYLVVGLLMWLCVLKSGIHATLAGVLLGLMIPFRAKEGSEYSPLRRLEHIIHPWVAFVILPLFAFANAGVSFAGMEGGEFTHPVTLGIALGLILGKPIGIVGALGIVTKIGFARLPDGISWRSLIGLGCLAGIGFTMSLFIGTLAFEGQGGQFSVYTRVGVFAGSIISALVGFLILRRTVNPS